MDYILARCAFSVKARLVDGRLSLRAPGAAARLLLELANLQGYTLGDVKYCVVIIDGAADLPLPDRGGRTCLELARTPNLDQLAREGVLGEVRTVPQGMEPSSACACMSIFGYDPKEYYRGRSGIEAISLGFPIADGEAGFRCNLVCVREGRMEDYSAGHIADGEARALVEALQEKLGNEYVRFFQGVGYRHLCKVKGHDDALLADCTPPHDIPGEEIDRFLPRGQGSDFLRDLMSRSVDVLSGHPVNRARERRGEKPANMIWLFWGSGVVPRLPSFEDKYGVRAALTSGVDLLRGLGKMSGVESLVVPGVTAGPDNDYLAQARAALEALRKFDLVFIHVEAPDEAGHAGRIEDKVEAIESVDREVVGTMLSGLRSGLRVLAMPDHPTPVQVRTHTADPVPFVLWGSGFNGNGGEAFSEPEANKTAAFVEHGHTIMERLIRG